MLKRFVFVFIALTCILGLSMNPRLAAADEVQNPDTPINLTLEQARDYAVKHNNAAANARLDVKAAKKKIWETTASGLPQVDAKLSYQNMTQMPVTLIPAEFIDPSAEPGTFAEMSFGMQHTATFEITANQLIFDGSYIVALQSSRTYLQLIKNSLTKSEIDTKATVGDTYYLILLAEDSLRILTDSLQNMEKILEETKAQHKAGFVEDTDVDQLQLTMTDLKNAHRSMERQVRIAYRLLKFQMGMDLDRKITLASSLNHIMKSLEAKQIMAQAFDLNKHIAYRMALTNEKAQKLLYKNSIASYLPKLSAYITHQKMAGREKFDFFKGGGQWYPSTIIGLKLDVPIFSSGMRLAQAAQAKIELKKARNDKREAEKGLKLELLQARSAFADAYEKSTATKKNAALAKRIYDKTKIKFAEGISSSLDLTQIHNQYLTAESNYTKAAVELLKAKTRLEKILSRL